MRRADKFFSIFIRLRDSDENGTGRCISCPKLLHWKDAHCGHFVRRGKQSTRYNEHNSHLTCVRCNTFLDGAEWEHGTAIDEKYGDGMAEYLKRKGQEICKRTKKDFDEIAEVYRKKCEERGWIA